ncbi:MAG: ATP-binding protein [Candidatus Zixiibacteriota bacterium]
MIVSVASGKGGTGKTTIAVNLALFLAQNGEKNLQFLDCDVEAPNAFIFLKPEIQKSQKVSLLVPEVDEKKCNFCGKCSEICAYNAIAVLKDKVLVFPQLCHGCGGCALFCPEKAIKEKQREIGVLEQGKVGKIDFIQGKLNISEPMATPVIREVKKKINPDGITIIDVPPGTSCPVIEAVNRSDFCLLVTEPTPFGLNDLKLAVEVLKKLKIKFGVIINRAGIGDNKVKKYCEDEGIEILAEIPYDRNVAVLYSQGISILIEADYAKIFEKLWDSVKRGTKQK